MRLGNTKLFSLSYRRVHGDLIEVCRIFNRLDELELEPLFKSNKTKKEGLTNPKGRHSKKLKHCYMPKFV